MTIQLTIVSQHGSKVQWGVAWGKWGGEGRGGEGRRMYVRYYILTMQSQRSLLPISESSWRAIAHTLHSIEHMSSDKTTHVSVCGG